MFFGRTDAEAETAILWPPHVKSWLIGKDPDSGKDWGQEEKGTTEDEMAGWHHQLDGHEFEWTPGVDDGQGGLACCNSWGHRAGHDWATELNWTEWYINCCQLSFLSHLYNLTVVRLLLNLHPYFIYQPHSHQHTHIHTCHHTASLYSFKEWVWPRIISLRDTCVAHSWGSSM